MVDPQLGAKYARLMATDRHHDSALCHLATILLTRIATCWRNGEHYLLRDIDGRDITQAEGRQIVRDRFPVDPKTRDTAAHHRLAQRQRETSQEHKESQSAPASRPPTPA